MDQKLKSDKLTINVGTMELGKMDMLVDNMYYSNRSDFCRIAIRELLEKHKEDFDNIYKQNTVVDGDNEVRTFSGIGVILLTKADLQRAYDSGRRINVMVTGLLVIDKEISSELFEATVSNIKVYGKMQASKGILDVIKGKESRND